ncbi:DUF2339 domain-containing protein, partial [Rubrivirga sp.]|uniref:DUF2339 domain-containing protein n=1 Tax=Rubrivirga sp. TaxID=1885344 RepID=UPI003C78180D
AAAAAGLVMVGLGWRLRRGTPGFGLTLQGGGVAVLYLTVYSAYALYGILPSLPAIALMAVVSVLCGALAVLQNAPGLAVLGVAGGFAAPVLAGTNDGSHILLLSYYALLNLGVLGVAWSKGWRSVAVVGFVSTFVTGGLWGGLRYSPDLYGSVQPFVILNFAIYLALAVRFAVRSAQTSTPERALVVDGALVFGLPAATFALQAGLIEGVVPFGRAWSAAILAVVYLVGAGLLRKRRDLGLLADGFLAVGLAFATLALPLAFERVLVGALWVLEGAGLVWVGMRQRKGWMKVAGIGLQAVAASVLFGEGVVTPDDAFTAETLTGWVVAVGLGLSAYLVQRPALEAEPETPALEDAGGDLALEADADRPLIETPPHKRWGIPGWERPASLALLGAALFWWTLTVTAHVLDIAADRHQLAAMLGATALSGALFVGLGKALSWRAIRVAAFGMVPAAGSLWVVALFTDTVLAAGWRGPAWLAVFASAAWALASGRDVRFRRPAYIGAVWLGAAVVAFVVGEGLVEGVRSDDDYYYEFWDLVWPLGAFLSVWVAALVASWRVPASWASRSERVTSTLGLIVAVVWWTMASWGLSGDADPLPTLPVLNPLGLPTVALLLVLVSVRSGFEYNARRVFSVVIGGLGFAALTVEVARGAHAAGAAAYDLDALYASSTVQAALAVTWTVLALVLTIVAARRESRGLWFFGAAILGLVVAKLFLVDLSQAEALVRIGAFLVVGTLVLLIGYRAPLPPARADHEPSPDLDA